MPAWGEQSSGNGRAAVEGPLTASWVQLYPAVTVLADRDGAEQPISKAYYACAVARTVRYTPDKFD
jgi:hypothetical protein